ncbi:endonuclease III domain-containing protein [Qipengyuania marisflavi]|uniref:Endonuclease III n=1 Tax=Qipengyuania marisflavi TaxID=2486356 RepID=A0A5S3P622_9SPHN|nr:endonuclease III [Qipengyuania marisflavi]TMM48414.1 endonuclease III [Qipengyuania marisflavi]
MHLPLGSDPRTDILRRTQAALIARFGRITPRLERQRDPLWTLVQGVIGARTKSAVSNTNTDSLLTRYGSWEAVAEAEEEALAAMLATATYPNMMAGRLKACLTAIVADRGAADLRHLSNLSTDTAMAWLEALPGVGRKIAAGVMNVSSFDRRAMVLDGHHRRIMQRMGLVPAKADTARAYDALMPIVPDEWSAADMDEHHLLLKKLGQSLCRPSRMACGECPVSGDCHTGQARNAKGA